MATLMSSAFTAANGTELDAYTPETNVPGSAWVLAAMDATDTAPAANDVEIQSNQLQIATSTKGAYYDTKVTDYEIQFPWVIGSTSGQRLAVYFRWQDKDNQYYFNIREPNDDWTLYKRAGGVLSNVATGSYTFNTSTTYTVKVVVSGTSCHLYINGASVSGAQTMDAYLTQTKIGLGSRTITTPAVFDSLTITNTPTVVAAGNVAPGGTVALALTGFPIAPTSVSLNGVTEAFSGTPTASSAVLQAPALSKFAAGQSHVNTRWQQDLTVRVAIGSFYAEDVTVQIDPLPSAGPYEDFSTVHPTEWYGPTIPGKATGDEIYGYYLSGYGAVEAGTGWFSPEVTGLPAQGRLMLFDISAGAWLAPVDTEIYSVPSTTDPLKVRVYLSVSLGV